MCQDDGHNKRQGFVLSAVVVGEGVRQHREARPSQKKDSCTARRNGYDTMMLRCRIAVVVSAFLLASCAGAGNDARYADVYSSLPPSIQAQLSTRPRPGVLEECPVSSTQAVFEDAGQVAGENPTWLTMTSRVMWSALGANVSSPVEGRLVKRIWILPEIDRARLVAIAYQLDGDTAITFADPDDVTPVAESEVELAAIPSPVFQIDGDQQPEIHSPDGYQFFGSAMIVPSPGCYEIAASTRGHLVTMVFEVLNK